MIPSNLPRISTFIPDYMNDPSNFNQPQAHSQSEVGDFGGRDITILRNDPSLYNATRTPPSIRLPGRYQSFNGISEVRSPFEEDLHFPKWHLLDDSPTERNKLLAFSSDDKFTSSPLAAACSPFFSGTSSLSSPMPPLSPLDTLEVAGTPVPDPFSLQTVAETNEDSTSFPQPLASQANASIASEPFGPTAISRLRLNPKPSSRAIEASSHVKPQKASKKRKGRPPSQEIDAKVTKENESSLEEKIQKRKNSNKIAAIRSRAKKKAHVDNLEIKVKDLEIKVDELTKENKYLKSVVDKLQRNNPLF